jgi:general secretion pathway protein D
MRRLSTFLFLALAFPAWSADTTKPACPAGDGGSCVASLEDQKQARKAFNRGVRLRDNDQSEEAFDEFNHASRLVPDNVEYATAREIVRQQLVYDALQRGNGYMLNRQQVEALAEFRTALELDPKNDFALQRMRDALGEEAPQSSPALRLAASVDDVQLQPRPGTAAFHYKGDTRGLIEAIASTFNVTVLFDDSFQAKQAKVDVPGLDFYQAMFVAGKLCKVFWAPISENQFLVASDTPENRRRFERMSLRSFYVSDATSPQALTELQNMLRAVFDIRHVSTQANKSILTIRAPRDTVEAASRFLEGLSGGPPQVMLDIQVYEVSSDALRDLGVTLPLQYTLFNLSNVLSQLQNQPNIQDLINQLFSGGGINQANSQAIQGLLAQLQNQANSILSNPVATFGGGITLMGLAIKPAKITANFNQSTVKSLEHLTMRARQGDTSSILIGTRYPILNASFSPIFNTPQIAQVIQNNSFQAAFPSFTFEDLGLTVKATPQIHATSDVTLKMEMHIRALGSQTFNGIPVIANREYDGTINLKNGETALMVGYVTRSEQRSLTGLPGLGQVVGLGLIASEESDEKASDELLVLITPHIIQSAEHEKLEVWMSK